LGLLRDSWPLLITAGLTMVYHRIDQLMLYHLAGGDALGHYSTAVRLVEATRILPIAVMVPLVPLMNRDYTHNIARFFKTYSLGISVTLVGAFLCLTILSFDAEAIVLLLFGVSYSPAAALIPILAWAEVILFLHLINGCALVASNAQRSLVWMMAGAALTNVVLNWILIPVHGPYGAAVATLVSYGMLPVSLLMVRNARGLFMHMISASWPVAIAGILAILTGKLVQTYSGVLSPWPVLLAGAVYIVACFGQRRVREQIALGVTALLDDDDARDGETAS
jgi:O-antigen/teichoic acid export membrane protein